MTVLRLVTLFLVATAIPVLGSGSAGAAQDPAPTPSPLTIQLLRMTPSTVPTTGRLKLVGTVTNNSSEIWQDINVEPFVSSVPITTSADLAAAAASPEDADVGNRLTETNTFDQIGDLAIGQTKSFRISLPRSALPIQADAPGVYWIGVHALGTDTAGRDSVADGRARTFIPLVPNHGVHTSTALVVPVRARATRTATGQLADAARWNALLAPDGRLDRVVTFASGTPVTWLIDPAVLDAAKALAAGNPPLSFGNSTSPTSTPSPSATATPQDLVQTNESAQGYAAAWLRRLTAATKGQDVLGLPYADPDIAALARHRARLIPLATDLADTTFKEFGLSATPAVAPPSGYLDDAALSELSSDTQIILTDHGQPSRTTQWTTHEGQPLVLADARAASGGPAPTPALDALALRQRILSEAALRAIAGVHTTMVTELPEHWDPGPGWRSADFFVGLDVPWLNVVPLSAPAVPAATYPSDLAYPARERKAEIRRPVFDAASQVIRTGLVLDHLLASDDNDVANSLDGAALAALSYDARANQTAAAGNLRSLDRGMRSQMDAVKVSGTQFVTLSGGSGSLTVTLVNDLKVPVTVGLRAEVAERGVSIEAPKPVQMGAGQRTTLRLTAQASTIGVHQVTLTPVTAEGEALGTPLQFTLRTSQVGKLIWAVIGAGGVLLFGMIIRRIIKKVRGRPQAAQ